MMAGDTTQSVESILYMVQDIVDLAPQVALHTAYLSIKHAELEAERLLQEMAQKGNGTFTYFEVGELIKVLFGTP
jgi:hypothetical protein